MPSSGAKYAFNLAVTVALICALQEAPAAESFGEFEREVPTTNIRGVSEKDIESLEENNDVLGELNYMPWSSKNRRKNVYVLPTPGKRNLEHLAKSSGGYLKHMQDENNDKIKREEAGEIIKANLGEILGKNKRGVHILAKNKDFPHNDDKMPKMKEVSIGTFMYSRYLYADKPRP